MSDDPRMKCPPISDALARHIRSLFPSFPETKVKSHADFAFDAGKASFAAYLLREHEAQTEGPPNV